MRVLGVDPGIARTGWGIIGLKNSIFKVQDFGCIETHPSSRLEERLDQIHHDISKIIDKYSPDELAIEELFWGSNAKTAFVVGQARGVILLAGAQKKIPVKIYTPLQVKIAVSGYGRAEKNQVGRMVKTILKLSEMPKPDDTTDALAVGLTHLFSRKVNSL
jgi:crossover junction endodeoxyribonuclease RuvC